MAVEYNPNDFGHPAPGQNPGHNSGHNSGHGQYPAPGQAAPQPYAPQPAPAAQPQGHPAPYVPPQGQPAPQQPPAYHYPPQQPQSHPQQTYPGQAYEQRPAQAYVPAQPGPQFQTPGEQQAFDEDKPKSRFRRAKKAKVAKHPRTKKVKQPSEGTSGSWLKPFLMGMVTGAVLTFGGLVLVGNQAKKSLQADFDKIATQLQQMPTSEMAIIGEDGTLSEDFTVAENPSEQAE